jgi:hypothetical protein
MSDIVKVFLNLMKNKEIQFYACVLVIGKAGFSIVENVASIYLAGDVILIMVDLIFNS